MSDNNIAPSIDPLLSCLPFLLSYFNNLIICQVAIIECKKCVRKTHIRKITLFLYSNKKDIALN